jgi:hypothetical protein
MKEESVHQELMNEAYEIYEEFPGIKKTKFIEKVMEKGDKYYHAVITGNLNYQVNNGGFSQWNENGYSDSIEELIEFFSQKFKEDKTIKKPRRRRRGSSPDALDNGGMLGVGPGGTSLGGI